MGQILNGVKSMEAFEIITKDLGGVPVLVVKGYCNGEAGEKLLSEVDLLASQKKTSVVIDFSECKVINSPGVAALMDLTLKVLDDFKGKLVVTGLDNLKKSVLSMARIIPMAGVAATVQEAAQQLK